jgi:hypothetical protein
MKGSGIGQMKHSMNNLFLETATMPPNVKDILNRRGAQLKSVGLQFNQQYKEY